MKYFNEKIEKKRKKAKILQLQHQVSNEIKWTFKISCNIHLQDIEQWFKDFKEQLNLIKKTLHDCKDAT